MLFLLLRLGILCGAVWLGGIDKILDTGAMRLRLLVVTRGGGMGGLVTCSGLHGCVCCRLARRTETKRSGGLAGRMGDERDENPRSRKNNNRVAEQ